MAEYEIGTGAVVKLQQSTKLAGAGGSALIRLLIRLLCRCSLCLTIVACTCPYMPCRAKAPILG